MAAKQDGFVRTALRIPPDLHKAVHDSAQVENRSFNGQLLTLLRAGLTTQTTKGVTSAPQT